jgi:hypothetical protein
MLHQVARPVKFIGALQRFSAPAIAEMAADLLDEFRPLTSGLKTKLTRAQVERELGDSIERDHGEMATEMRRIACANLRVA